MKKNTKVEKNNKNDLVIKIKETKNTNQDLCQELLEFIADKNVKQTN